MTIVREEEETTLQTDHSPLGRTFAMTVVSVGYGLMTVGLAYLVSLFMRATDDSEVAALVPVFASITAFMAIVGSRLPDVVGGTKTTLVLARQQSSRPADPPASQRTLSGLRHHPPDHSRIVPGDDLVLAGGLAVISGGITAFVETRRGRASGRAPAGPDRCPSPSSVYWWERLSLHSLPARHRRVGRGWQRSQRSARY